MTSKHQDKCALMVTRLLKIEHKRGLTAATEAYNVMITLHNLDRLHAAYLRDEWNNMRRKENVRNHRK